MLIEASNEEGFEVVVRKTDRIIEQNDEILARIRSQGIMIDRFNTFLDDFLRNKKGQEEEEAARRKQRKKEEDIREMKRVEAAARREQEMKENARAREEELIGMQPSLTGSFSDDTDNSHRREPKNA
jgi:hypothetical protein